MTNINIRIDETLKSQAEAVLAGLGMNMTTATTIFLKQVVRTNSIPFEIRNDPYTTYVENALNEANADARAGAKAMSYETFRKRAEARLNELSG